MTSWLKRTRRILISVICCATVLFTACSAKPQQVTPVVDYRDLVEPLDQKPMETASEESVQADADAVATWETKEPEDNVITITISAAGDVTLGNYEGQDYSGSFRQKVEETEDEGYFFSNVYDIFSADDMTIVNLEGVLTTSEEIKEGQTYCIKGDPSYVAFLTHGAIETVSMANNHRMDFGEAGSRETVEMLDREGIIYAYDNNVGIYETKGIRIGYVSVRYWGEGMEYLMQNGIEKLQEEGVDLILACCHWGIERTFYPEDYQREFGKKCIDWGADLVIGHHPHVLQGIEEYRGKFIVYSLANFCFGANRNPPDKDTMIFQQTFTFVDGMKQEDANIQVIPCSVSSISNWNDYRPTPAIDNEAQRILERINEYSRDFGVQFDESGHLKTGE
ncbi:MAG: CapA family protein [Acetatifactor sp.]|nr:CapA family protein [Acetatifactor sp.]